MSAERRRPYVVAVTGGIAAGKTAVTDRLAALGAPVIDADAIARELVEPGEPALAEVFATFGKQLARADGRLDRRALRAIVFANPAKRAQLEAILHPRVERRMRELVGRCPFADYVVLAIPLLAEVGRYDFIDRVVVVDAPLERQVERLMQRDDVTREKAIAAIGAQVDRATRLAVADDVVVNDGTRAALQERTDALHGDVLARALAR